MKTWIYAALATSALFAPKSAGAHGFGQRYDLPMPLSYYLVGSGLVVGLSFVLLIATARRSVGPQRTVWHHEISLDRWPGWLTRSALAIGRAIGLAALLLVIVAGFLGDQSPIRNIAPSLVWILTWVGLAFFCALCVNAWLFLNPWHALFLWGTRALEVVGLARTPSTRFRYPDWLGTWPAVALFWCFAWAELAWSGGETPSNLAWLAVGYTGLTITGMAAYGPTVWLKHGEFFTVFFGLMGRFAPIGVSRNTNLEVRTDTNPMRAPQDVIALSQQGGDHVLVLRPFGAGMTTASARSVSASAFIVLMLSTVTLDGLMETPFWTATQDTILSTEFLAPALFALRDVFGDVRDGLETVALLVVPALAFVVFYAINALMRQVSQRRSPDAKTTADAPASSMDLVGWFAMSLLPIAIGYHFAHYLSFILIAGQLSIPLASDPLGLGWDLFGTGGYRIDIGIINARTTWYVALVSIVLGHMIAVVLAHITAVRVFKDRRLAATSELPMIALMIGYTSLSLWILAQPIVD